MSRARRLHQGFTLLEVLVVLALLGVVMGVMGMSLAEGYRERNLRSSALDLAYQLEQARANSVKMSADQTVTLTNTSGRVDLVYGTKTVRANNATFSLCSNTAGAASCSTNATSMTITYTAPQGEMCWSTGGSACSYTDVALQFSNAPYKTMLILQGVFGYASVRDIP